MCAHGVRKCDWCCRFVVAFGLCQSFDLTCGLRLLCGPTHQIFDKTVRALESAVNRLPGMHEMGLEHLILEEPPPPAPPTPTAGATTAPGATPAPVTPHRPTAPGKTSIPWAFDAIGPLSQLARQVSASGLCILSSKFRDLECRMEILQDFRFVVSIP